MHRLRSLLPPSRRQHVSRLIPALRFPLLIALLLFFLQVLPGPRAFEDAHITYRYARNLARGEGLVYNPGERVYGTTTPLYAALLALVSRVTSNEHFPWLSIWLNAIFDLGATILLVRLLDSFGVSPFVSRLISIAYLLSPLRMRVALGGMETSMAIFWLLAASYLYTARKDHARAAICSGLAALTRPELVLLGGLLTAHETIRSRRIPWRSAAAFAAVLAPWVLFAWFYFGSPLPQTIVAKSNAYLLHPYQAGIDLLAYVATRSRSSLRSWTAVAIGIAAVISIWLYVVGAWRTVQKNREALPLALFSPVYSLALGLANPLLFIWYYPPLLLFQQVFVALGILRFLESSRRRLRMAVMSLAITGLVVFEWSGTGGIPGWLASLRGREDLYAAVAVELRSQLEPGSSIGLPEIGVFGYVLEDHRVLDTVGLVTPRAVPHLLQEPAPGQTFTYAISEGVIEELRPDYLITLEIFVRPTLMQSTNFQSDYRLIQRYASGALDSDGLLVFQRVSSR